MIAHIFSINTQINLMWLMFIYAATVSVADVSADTNAPTEGLVIHTVSIDILPWAYDGKHCQIWVQVQIDTNQPNQELNFVLSSRPSHDYPRYVIPSPFSLTTASSGIASGRFFVRAQNVPGASEDGEIMITARIPTFQTTRAPYRLDCDQVGHGLDIKKLRVNPELQIPRNQLPVNAPITRPDAPDSRLTNDQQSGNAPASKLKNSNIQIQQQKLPERAPALKPVTPNSGLKKHQVLKKPAVIESVDSNNRLKQKQLPGNTPDLKINESVVGEEEIPELKPRLK